MPQIALAQTLCGCARFKFPPRISQKKNQTKNPKQGVSDMHQLTYEECPELEIIQNQWGFTRAGGLVPPFFYDVTPRDGNQALRKPWEPEEKMKVFGMLCELGVQGVEAGFAAASDKDFDSVVQIAQAAPKGMVIGALAFAREDTIYKAAQAFASCSLGIPMLHTFLGMSPFHMENSLGKSPNAIIQMAVNAVVLAREVMGEEGLVQFSPEHFGDCITNLDWVIEKMLEIVHAGKVNVINLPNTVERYRPEVFAYLVRRVVKAMPDWVRVAVHCHNDLDMATASTVAGYFAGADRLEVTINGLGERPGNTRLHTTAVALHNAGVPIDLAMERIYEVSLKIAEISGIPIHEKDALIGRDIRAQRSGVHQSGVIRTFNLPKGAYRPIDWTLIGRAGDDEIEFTSQSGYSAAKCLIQEGGRTITVDEAKLLMPALTNAADRFGQLTMEELVAVYEAYLELVKRKDIVEPEDMRPITDEVIEGMRKDDMWRVISASHFSTPDERAVGYVVLVKNGDEYMQSADGDGPVDAVCTAIERITGIEPELTLRGITPVSEGQEAQGSASLTLTLDGLSEDAERTHTDIVIAVASAYIAALNALLRKNP
jgi:2-isopropylmalate synthase